MECFNPLATHVYTATHTCKQLIRQGTFSERILSVNSCGGKKNNLKLTKTNSSRVLAEREPTPPKNKNSCEGGIEKGHLTAGGSHGGRPLTVLNGPSGRVLAN